MGPVPVASGGPVFADGVDVIIIGSAAWLGAGGIFAGGMDRIDHLRRTSRIFLGDLFRPQTGSV